ncbi:hypothetical protein ACFGVR_15675 [Mucilaginibacter sp. AW1-3]
MRTEKTSALLVRIVAQLRPRDLVLSEHRSALRERIETLRHEKGWDNLQFGRSMRMELNELRHWLSGARELTIESLTEICDMFYISIGDLVHE